MKTKRKNTLYKKNTRSRVAANTRTQATKEYLLPSRSMSHTALPNSQNSHADEAFALETLEDLYAQPSTARLSRNGDSLCDNQGHTILRAGEQV
jgi:hypothetical protein